jgi:hypothetical protein
VVGVVKSIKRRDDNWWKEVVFIDTRALAGGFGWWRGKGGCLTCVGLELGFNAGLG